MQLYSGCHLKHLLKTCWQNAHSAVDVCLYKRSHPHQALRPLADDQLTGTMEDTLALAFPLIYV